MTTYKHINVLILIHLTILIVTISQYINCVGIEKCKDDTINCDPHDDYCHVDCNGFGSCYDAKINCAGTANCSITCIDKNSCFGADINGAEGNLFVTGYKSRPMGYSKVNCPSNSFCNISCFDDDYNDACCDYINIDGNINNGTILYVNVSGGLGSLTGAEIKCPADFIRNGSNNNCNIFISSEYINALSFDRGSIYAVEGFKDVNFVCNTVGNGCFYDAPLQRARIYCKADYSAYCEFYQKTNSINNNEWKCIDETNICNHYLLPTPIPTTSPTDYPSTEPPTFSPTLYNRNDEPPRTLYVSSFGCDYGFCEYDYGDYSVYCDNNWFYNHVDTGYYNKCCSPSSISTTELVLTTNDIDDNGNCSQFSIVYINDDGTFNNSAITYLDQEKVKTLCFELKDDYICTDPVVEVKYDPRPYNSGPRFDEYLNVAYQYKTNLMNNNECWGGTFCELNVVQFIQK